MNEIELEKKKLSNCYELFAELLNGYSWLVPNHLRGDETEDLFMCLNRMYLHEVELLGRDEEEYVRMYSHKPMPQTGAQEKILAENNSEHNANAEKWFEELIKRKRQNSDNSKLHPNDLFMNVPTENDTKLGRRKQLNELMKTLNNYFFSTNIMVLMEEPKWKSCAELLKFCRTVRLELKISEKRLTPLGPKIIAKVNEQLETMKQIQMTKDDLDERSNPQKTALLKFQEKGIMAFLDRNTVNDIFVADVMFEFAPGKILFMQTGIEDLDKKLMEQLGL